MPTKLRYVLIFWADASTNENELPWEEATKEAPTPTWTPGYIIEEHDDYWVIGWEIVAHNTKNSTPIPKDWISKMYHMGTLDLSTKKFTPAPRQKRARR